MDVNLGRLSPLEKATLTPPLTEHAVVPRRSAIDFFLNFSLLRNSLGHNFRLGAVSISHLLK